MSKPSRVNRRQFLWTTTAGGSLLLFPSCAGQEPVKDQSPVDHQHGLFVKDCSVKLHTSPEVPPGYVAELCWQVIAKTEKAKLFGPYRKKFRPEPPQRPNQNEEYPRPARLLSERASLYWLKYSDSPKDIDWRKIPPAFSDKWTKVHKPTSLSPGAYFVVAIADRVAARAKDMGKVYEYPVENKK